jgi:hypothetical protein
MSPNQFSATRIDVRLNRLLLTCLCRDQLLEVSDGVVRAAAARLVVHSKGRVMPTPTPTRRVLSPLCALDRSLRRLPIYEAPMCPTHLHLTLIFFPRRSLQITSIILLRARGFILAVLARGLAGSTATCPPTCDCRELSCCSHAFSSNTRCSRTTLSN